MKIVIGMTICAVVFSVVVVLICACIISGRESDSRRKNRKKV